MKKTFVKDIKEKDQVESTFLVTRKDACMSRSGKLYLTLTLMDSTGEVEGRVWEDAEHHTKNFNKNDVVKVKGFAVPYQGGLQINISLIESVPEGEYSLKDYLPSSERDPEEMMVELEGIIDGIRDRYIKALLQEIFRDRDIRERFKLVPAAKSMHHPYIGGLVEHVLSMCRLVRSIGHIYQDLNTDLLLAGAILHDIGKIFEISFKGVFEYTDRGRLLGHINMGVELIEEKIRTIPAFPEKLSTLIKHMILSHHGHLEFGSPKRPKTLEALVLYYIDDLDAKVHCMRFIMKKDTGTSWSAYNRFFERYIYRERYLSEPEKEERPLSAEELKLFGE